MTTGSGRLASLARWESFCGRPARLIVLGTALSPFFLTPGNFANLLAALMEVAIMALPMTLIIIAGEIDLSVEAMAGLAARSSGSLVRRHPDLDRHPVRAGRRRAGRPDERPPGRRGGLPSLVVTLGTLALFRGMALIVLGPNGVSDFPPASRSSASATCPAR